MWGYLKQITVCNTICMMNYTNKNIVLIPKFFIANNCWRFGVKATKKQVTVKLHVLGQCDY